MKFWLPYEGIEKEILIPAEYVDSIMIPAAEHEAGHAIAARHFGGRVFGIAVGFIPEQDKRGMFFQVIYDHDDWPIVTQCVVKTAGPAADLLSNRPICERGASVDLKDIENLTGIRSFDPYLEQAKRLLHGYSQELEAVSAEIRKELTSPRDRYLGLLPNGRIGSLLIDEAALNSILGTP